MSGPGRIRLWAVVFWLAVWQIASMAIHQDLFLVSPVRVVVRLGQLVAERDFWRSFWRWYPAWCWVPLPPGSGASRSCWRR